MDKYIKNIDANLEKIKAYEDFDSVIFFEMLSKIEEAKKCILFEMPIASITLSNHIIERALKLGLIYDYSELKSVPEGGYGNHYTEAHIKFNHLTMNETIDRSRKQKLISSKHAEVLHNIRKKFRNGFGHGDHENILLDSPDFVPALAGHLQDSNKNRMIELNIKTHPGLNAHLGYEFAKNNYVAYFGFVYRTMLYIEAALKKKHNITDW